MNTSAASPGGLVKRVMLAALAGLAGQALGCEKTVRWSEDRPYSYRQEDGQIVGRDIDIVGETLRRLGCRAKLVEMPWARALAELEAGRLDILPGTLHLPERDRFAYFSRPGPQSDNRLFMHTRALARWRPGRLDELIGTDFRLGVQRGVAYGPDYEALMRDAQFATRVHTASSRSSLWRMVQAGRLDGVLANEGTGHEEIAQLGLAEQIKESGVRVAHGPASVAFSRKSVAADFVERYKQADAAMQRDGSLSAIMARHPRPAAPAQAAGPARPAK